MLTIILLGIVFNMSSGEILAVYPKAAGFADMAACEKSWVENGGEIAKKLPPGIGIRGVCVDPGKGVANVI